jgi:hypothetical protein
MAKKFNQETAESWLKDWLDEHNVVNAEITWTAGPSECAESFPPQYFCTFDVQWTYDGAAGPEQVCFEAYVYSDQAVHGEVETGAEVCQNKITVERAKELLEAHLGGGVVEEYLHHAGPCHLGGRNYVNLKVRVNLQDGCDQERWYTVYANGDVA